MAARPMTVSRTRPEAAGRQRKAGVASISRNGAGNSATGHDNTNKKNSERNNELELSNR